MNKDELFEELADILDVESVNDADILRDFDSWDSLAVLSILAMADSKFGILMKAIQLKSLETVTDLVVFLESNRTK